MSDPCATAAMSDAVIKIGLTALGTLLGAAVTAFVARTRLRRLGPSLRRQIRDAAEAAQAAFSPEELKACLSLLESSVQVARDYVAAGVSMTQWKKGLELVEEARNAAATAAAADLRALDEATTALHRAAAKVTAWSALVRG